MLRMSPVADSIDYDLENKFLRDSNDLIIPMAAWLALGDGGTIGAKHAAFKIKRITKTAELLSRFGIKSTINDDGITVPGGQIRLGHRELLKHLMTIEFR